MSKSINIYITADCIIILNKHYFMNYNQQEINTYIDVNIYHNLP